MLPKTTKAETEEALQTK